MDQYTTRLRFYIDRQTCSGNAEKVSYGFLEVNMSQRQGYTPQGSGIYIDRPRKFPTFFGGEYVTPSRVTDLEHLYLTRAVAARDPDWRAHPFFSQRAVGRFSKSLFLTEGN